MYFVDNRQALHFKQLFATAEKACLSTSLTRGGGEDLRQRKEKREEIKESSTLKPQTEGKEVVSCPPDKSQIRRGGGG
jgi:hypothetical protein